MSVITAFSLELRATVLFVRRTLFLKACACACVRVCSDDEPEGVIPTEKLVALCKYEPVRLWMRSCDHILYQALVEILIPDVLRPVPSQYC